MTSRIQKSIKNAQVNMIFYVIIMILAFFSRKIFLENLGTEFLGLSSMLGDILNLMNITELGIGTAVGVTLYKPLFDDDRLKIKEIISVFGFLYYRIGFLIAFVGIVLSCFFPLIFNDTNIPLVLVYFMFYSMVYGALLGYFFNYRQIVLSASQNNYIIIYRYQTIMVVKVLLQIGTSFLPYCFIWWIIMELIASTVNSIILHWSVKRHYPWLHTSIKLGKAKFKDYQSLWTKTKQVFVLKLSHLVFNGSINVFIGMFVSLPMVAIYGNYNMVMSKLTSFVDGLFTAMEASVGNLIAENNKDKTLNVFFELLSLRYFLAGLLCIILYFTVPVFIVVWLGEEFLLERTVLLLISIHLFFQQGRLTVDNFKNGYGLYSDIWAPISEVVIFLVLSLTIGRYWGLIGILIAFIVPEFLIKMIWKPYFLFKEGFHESVVRYYWQWLKFILFLGLTFIIIYSMKSIVFQGLCNDSWTGFIIYSFIISISTFIVLSSLFFVSDKYFRSLIKRMKAFKRS